MRVVRLVDEADWKSLWPIVENIFFATSRIQIFADEQARNSFKARWLDRYLNHYIDSFFIARPDDGPRVGRSPQVACSLDEHSINLGNATHRDM
jgi:hypothetical protein